MGLIQSVALAKRYLKLLPVIPPSYYKSGAPLERARMEYESEQSPDGFHHIFNLNLAGKDVLDVGCGYGGRTVWYRENGAKSVAGIEISEAQVQEARAFAAHQGVGITAVCGVGENLPFPDNSFDMITSYDVFEHVESLEKTLKECYRVLRAGGTLYAVFPPFYHPTGGSHLHGYVSRSPAPNVIFDCAALCDAVDEIVAERTEKYKPPRRLTDPLPGVNGTTIKQFRRWLDAIPFRDKRVTLAPLQSQKLSWLNPALNVGRRLPVVREICTDRIVCELTK